MNRYIIEESEKAPININWLGSEGLQFMQMLTDNEQERSQASSWLFEV